MTAFSRFLLPVAVVFMAGAGQGQITYNHPELDWQTFETEHFRIHFYQATEATAREGAAVAEKIYPLVTGLYRVEPREKTHLVFLDTDDYSNGAAYYYDNKIVIWASPLDFALRGSHRWLQNVITHEFTHIVSMRAAMKAGQRFPALYLQQMGYERERRRDVLYGYPNTLISYAVPMVVVPPWLAEGLAQYMYDGATWDTWDTHRDMLLRDRVLNGEMLTFAEMNVFGKRGTGNESVYNSGYALTRYIAVKYGTAKLEELVRELARPGQYSIVKALENVLGLSAGRLFSDFRATLETRYGLLTESIRTHPRQGALLRTAGTTNIYPVWSPEGSRIAYLSNQDNDYFSQTDLYVYETESGKETKISRGVFYAACWHPSGKVLYYTRKAKYPDRHGSRYFDLYEYNFDDRRERRITRQARAYSPVFVESDSALYYLASRDGVQDIYRIDLRSRTSRRLTKFEDRRSLFNLKYDRHRQRLIFDYTVNHFRNIGYVSLVDSVAGDILANSAWDERDAGLTPDGAIVYSDDRSGVANLYLIEAGHSRQGYLTNVPGGAFMPDVSRQGRVVYSLYTQGGYKLAVLDTLKLQEQVEVGYSPLYFTRNNVLDPPLTDQVMAAAEPYSDNFVSMFTIPKLMLDYGTLKPGFYFYSTEVLERATVFGQASANRSLDLDLYIMFELRRFYPTLYLECIYLTRNKLEQVEYSVYPIDSNLRFRLVQFGSGMRLPVLGISELDFYATWQRYRAFIKESIPSQNLQQGLAYDYFRGWSAGLRWEVDAVKQTYDRDLNPSAGFRVRSDVRYEHNDFIHGLNLSQSGTLVEEFSPNHLVRTELQGAWYREIPGTGRWTVALEVQAGWLSNAAADSFFNFFAGGLPGIKGYPFYSLEGRRMSVTTAALRIPWLRLQHLPLGWFTLQNSTLGFILQAGDAWSGPVRSLDLKRSLGFQLRFSGFSFYNLPTAIGLEVHRGWDKFTRLIDGQKVTYGEEPRFYATVLFGF